MKKINVILSVVLVLLVLIGWGVQLLGMAKTNAQYSAYVQQGNQYSEECLYQKAIQSYENAIQIDDNRSVRELWMESYENGFRDKVTTLDAYITALETMCGLYEKEALYWEKLIAVQIEYGRMDDAYDTLVKFNGIGIASAAIEENKNTILYQYRVNRKTYLDFVRDTTGYYTVKDSRGWGIIRPNGETVYDCVYEYIGPYNSNYDALFVSEKGQRIADAKAVIQAKINVEYTKTGAWSGGLLPVCDLNGEWYYLACETNTNVHGGYSQASNYAAGIAAVCKDDVWMLVDTGGNPVSEKRFSHVKLHGNGEYQYDGIMIAAENGKYGIYDAKGNMLCDLGAGDMDIYLGGAIAYCDPATGKWGMVSRAGETVIQPTFAMAKSFSNKLAAVSNGEAWGFINTSAEAVIDYQFQSADYFTNKGLCAVSTTGIDYVFIQLKYIHN